jgi:DNA (cytosine-5)-methyltransferase 3A
MNVLSLCDGMSCGQIALEKNGVKADKYFASEIKDIAIKVAKDNYPNTIHIGDMTKVKYENGILKTEKGEFYVGHIDLLIGGSPCQNLSIAMKKEMRLGLKGDKSILFWEYLRILKEVNPKYFLLENVAKMPNEDKNIITSEMKVEPIRINSKLVSAQLRDRLYWTNIPGVCMPVDKGIKLKDIITSGYVDKEKARALVVSESRPLKSRDKMMHRYKTTGMLTLVFEDINNKEETCRIFNQTELERLQTVPKGYTKCLNRNQAADVLGDGWTVDVIAHILKGIKKI